MSTVRSFRAKPTSKTTRRNENTKDLTEIWNFHRVVSFKRRMSLPHCTGVSRFLTYIRSSIKILHLLWSSKYLPLLHNYSLKVRWLGVHQSCMPILSFNWFVIRPPPRVPLSWKNVIGSPFLHIVGLWRTLQSPYHAIFHRHMALKYVMLYIGGSACCPDVLLFQFLGAQVKMTSFSDIVCIEMSWKRHAKTRYAQTIPSFVPVSDFVLEVSDIMVHPKLFTQKFPLVSADSLSRFLHRR